MEFAHTRDLGTGVFDRVMTSSLLWKFNRLQTMNRREVIHRLSRHVKNQLEQAGLRMGRVPRPTRPVTSRLSLFGGAEKWAVEWHKRYRLDEPTLDRLMSGHITLFGYPELQVGNLIDWHRDPLTGIESPLEFGKSMNYRDSRLVGNIKVLWELGRHQYLMPIAVAYAISGDEHFRNVLGAQVDHWIAANPYGRGVHWCSALEVALRLTSWSLMHGLLSLKDGKGLFAAVRDPAGLSTSIYQHAYFIHGYLSRHSSANNHLLGELTGLFTGCTIFDMGGEGERWRAQTQAELEAQARLQVYPDGVDREQSTNYHLQVLEYLLLNHVVAKRNGVPLALDVDDTIHRMAMFVRDITPRGGEPLAIGDSDDGWITRFDLAQPPAGRDLDTLSAIAVLLDLPEAVLTSRQFGQKVFWYALMAGEIDRLVVMTRVETMARPYPRVYKDGGYAVLGDETIHVVFDAGDLGYLSIAGHGHADALSVCVAIDGVWWLVDPGTFSYHGDAKWRNYFRGTSAHNTVMIDGKNQSVIGGPFMWLRHAKALLVSAGVKQNMQHAQGEHFGYGDIGVVHRRKVLWSCESPQIRIDDDLVGAGHHEVSIYFHFAPGTMLAGKNFAEGVWAATRSDSTRRLILTLDPRIEWTVVCGSETPVLGWYSGALGMKEKCPTLQGRVDVKLPAVFKMAIEVQNC